MFERGSLLGTQPFREKDQKSHFGLKDVPLELETLSLSSESWFCDVPTETRDTYLAGLRMWFCRTPD